MRGNGIAMIFQDPLSSLHPLFRVGDQLVEAIQAHREVSSAAARERAIELLGEVGIPNPKRRVDDYPHEFSGGMRQRAMIAMALSNEPRLLIADEPTTALDVTTQAQILTLIDRLEVEHEMAVILITHDLGVVAENADDVAVMYAGRIVEQAGVEDIFSRPHHPYTWGLLRSIPSLASEHGDKLVPDPGAAAEPHLRAAGVLVSPALPLRAAAPPRGRAAARTATGRPEPPCRLPPRPGDARAPLGGARGRPRSRGGPPRASEAEAADG